MKYYLLVVLITVFAFSPSCHKSTITDCDADLHPDCSTIYCILHLNYFGFRLVDPVSGEDLLFGANPRYTTTDVKLYFDASRTMPTIITADNINKQLRCLNGRDEMYLEVKGSAVYKLDAVFRKMDCCSDRVKSLQVDGRSLCTCCSDVIEIPVN